MMRCMVMVIVRKMGIGTGGMMRIYRKYRKISLEIIV